MEEHLVLLGLLQWRFAELKSSVIFSEKGISLLLNNLRKCSNVKEKETYFMKLLDS